MTAPSISFIISLGNALDLDPNEPAHAQPKPDVAQRYRHRNQEKLMIKASKERVRELIRSLESVKVRVEPQPRRDYVRRQVVLVRGDPV